MYIVPITDTLRSRNRWPIRPLTIACLVLLLGAARGSVGQGSLSLHDAIQKALRSAEVQVADARVEEARGGLRQAGLRPNPRLYLQSEDLRPWANDFAFPTQTEDYGYLGQTFELGGKRTKRIELATARLRQAETARSLRVRQMAASVSTAYWNAVGLRRVSELLAEDLKAVDEMVRYHRERVNNGAMKGVDLLRMQIERDRLGIALAAAQREAAQAKLEVFREMGVEASEVTLSDGLDIMPTPAAVEFQSALAQRPEIAAAQSAVRVAEDDLKLQKATGVPDPDILGGYKRNNGDNTLYASLQIPLPFRNRNQGEIERAQASITAAKASLVSVQLQISIEMQQAQAAFTAQQKIVRDILPDMRAHAQQNLDIISEAYRLGGVDLLRYIDAERTKFDVEANAARVLAQLQQSAVQLQLAYGIQP